MKENIDLKDFLKWGYNINYVEFSKIYEGESNVCSKHKFDFFKEDFFSWLECLSEKRWNKLSKLIKNK